ncbi:MAG: magnesium transporter MgtE [Candidatus Roseilinea sp.]|nr:MAG: magnesium transporter MgtE [Candidatus Roseilinea sp.]
MAELTRDTVDRALAQVRAALDRNNVQDAIAVLERLRQDEQVEVFDELDVEDQAELLPRLDPETAADIVVELDAQDQADIAQRVDDRTLSRILDEMEPDDAADVIGELPQERQARVLASMEEADDVRPLLIHPDESAGGLMTTSFLTLRPGMTAQEAIDALREWNPDDEMPYYLFVVDRERRLVGVVSLRQLLVASPNRLIGSIMNPDVISVPVGADQEEVANLMRKHDFLALPVVDANNRLLGIITVDDVVDVIEEEATEDVYRFGAVEPGVLNKPYFKTSLTRVVRSRVGWLVLLFVAETFTGSVLRVFEHELATVVALSFFIPLLIGTGGNTGAQTVSTIIRGLALREIQPGDLFRVLSRELMVGLLLGASLGVIAFLRAELWGSGFSLSLVVGLSILVICTWANTIGSLIPLLAQRFKIDPAIVSAPLITTLVDATGLAIYLMIARLLLPELRGGG